MPAPHAPASRPTARPCAPEGVRKPRPPAARSSASEHSDGQQHRASSPASHRLALHLSAPCTYFQTQKAAALLLQGCTWEQGQAWEQAVPTLALFPAQVLALFSHLKPPSQAPGRGDALSNTSPIWVCTSVLTHAARDEPEPRIRRIPSLFASTGARQALEPPVLLPSSREPQPLWPPEPSRSPRDPSRAPGGTHPLAPGLLEEPLRRRARARVRTRCR